MGVLFANETFNLEMFPSWLYIVLYYMSFSDVNIDFEGRNEIPHPPTSPFSILLFVAMKRKHPAQRTLTLARRRSFQ